MPIPKGSGGSDKKSPPKKGVPPKPVPPKKRLPQGPYRKA